MTADDLDADDSPDELSPDDDESVRRLLAAATVRMPDDVTGRLDAVLAGLQTERTRAGTAPVADLSRRRARRWPKVLVAAATVAVVGVGLGGIIENTSGGGDSAGSADTADTAAEAPKAGLPETEADGSGAAPQERSKDTLLGAGTSTSDLPRVRTGSLPADAQRIYDHSPPLPGYERADGDAAEDPDSSACDLPAVSRGGRLVAVRLGGERATLLFGPKQGRHRPAELYSCHDAGSPVQVTTVDAP